MAAPVRYLSGRQQQQKIGIVGNTDNEKVLEVVGRVGIGTTVFEPSTELDIRGSVSIANTITASTINATNVITTGTGNTFSDLQVSGISTFTGLVDANGGLDVTGHSELDDVNVSGAITATTFTGNLIGTVTTAAQPNITSLGTLSALTVSGDITANGNIAGDNSTNITGIASVTATTLSGTLQTAAQPNITSVGTLTELSVTGITSSSAFADFDYLQAPFGSTVTFTVTVASKDASHRYNGTGSGNAYLINGVQAPFLTLTPGRTYRFTNDNTGSHPFKFYLEADKTTEYTSGVNFQNTYTEITIGDETPVVLHYQCTAHGYMGNAIQVNSNVVNTNYAATLRDSLTVSGNINANGNIVGDNSTNISGINQATATTFVGNLTGTASTATIATYTSEWNITANGSSDYRFTGPGFDGTENDPTIYLTRGEEYKFTNNMGAHPFQIRTSINGSAYNDGVTNNGVSNGTLTWDVQMDAPNILYYQCTSHAGMVGKIYIGNSGSSIDIDGHTETDTLNVSGLSTFVGLVTVTSGDVHIAQRLFVGGLEVEGTGSENTFTGINTFTNQQDNILGNTNTGSLQGNGGFGIDKNASFGDKVFVQNAIGINSTAPTTQLDVNGGANVSGALTATSLNVTNKLTTTGLGISIANGTGNTAYIEGPSQIWIDPAPAGVGTTSGIVRIRGDLYVDGTEFIVDVDRVQLGDFRIGIATTVGTNVLLNGAGLGIGSESIEKTITWNNATSALMSSENWNLAAGKHYEINGTDVLTSTTLGSGVVNSSLTSVGTLSAVTVSGNITANGNIVGDTATNISGINSVTATSFHGNGAGLTNLSGVIPDVVSDTTPQLGGNLDLNSKLINGTGGVNITGIITATSFVGNGANITGITASQVGAIGDVVSDTTPQLGGNLDLNSKLINGTGGVNITGIITATSFTGTVNTAAQTNITSLGTLSAVTVSGNITANGNIVGDNSTNISGINSVTATSFVGNGANITGLTASQVGALADIVSDTTPQLGGNLDINSKLINGTGGVNITGVVTATDFNSTSDENLKENIRTIEDPLAKVIQIRGVNFDWKETQKPSVGVVAQEVEKVLPELVQLTQQGEGGLGEHKTVNYNGLIGLLIEVVKEQQTQINSLNERLSKLE